MPAVPMLGPFKALEVPRKVGGKNMSVEESRMEREVGSRYPDRKRHLPAPK